MMNIHRAASVLLPARGRPIPPFNSPLTKTMAHQKFDLKVDSQRTTWKIRTLTHQTLGGFQFDLQSAKKNRRRRRSSMATTPGPTIQSHLWVFSALCDSSNFESDLLISSYRNIKKSCFRKERWFKMHESCFSDITLGQCHPKKSQVRYFIK